MVKPLLVLAAAVVIAACDAAAPGSSPIAQGSPVPTTTGSPIVISLPPSEGPSPTAESSAEPPPTIGPPPSEEPTATWAPSPQPSIALRAAGAPAIPTKVKFLQDQPCDLGPDTACFGDRIDWQESDPTAVTVRVYAVTTCLHEPTPSSGDVKCLKSGDTIPEDSLIQLGEVPAATSTLSFQLQGGETPAMGSLPINGPTVYAVVIQAVNADGGSFFAFAFVTTRCFGCTA